MLSASVHARWASSKAHGPYEVLPWRRCRVEQSSHPCGTQRFREELHVQGTTAPIAVVLYRRREAHERWRAAALGASGGSMVARRGRPQQVRKGALPICYHPSHVGWQLVGDEKHCFAKKQVLLKQYPAIHCAR